MNLHCTPSTDIELLRGRQQVFQSLRWPGSFYRQVSRRVIIRLLKSKKTIACSPHCSSKYSLISWHSGPADLCSSCRSPGALPRVPALRGRLHGDGRVIVRHSPCTPWRLRRLGSSFRTPPRPPAPGRSRSARFPQTPYCSCSHVGPTGCSLSTPPYPVGPFSAIRLSLPAERGIRRNAKAMCYVSWLTATSLAE